MRWTRSHRFDPRALPLADRHYNRRKIGSPQFVPPGRNIVLLTEKADALWVSSWPFAEYVRHAWPGAWVCTLFRNESAALSSELIREAVAATRSIWGDAPPLGMVTFINEDRIRVVKVRGVPTPGFSYLKAGFERLEERTKEEGHLVFRMLGARMPRPEPPLGGQLELRGAA